MTIGKRGELNLSFGMIFSIILIIAFISSSFYGIKKFLDIQNRLNLETFADNLKNDVDKLWKSSQGSKEVQYSLPSKVKEVCFFNDEYENFLLRNSDEQAILWKKIEHIDLEKITKRENPYCIETEKGKVQMILKKNYDEVLVTITKEE